ncbi:ribosome maturation factor RimM [Algoriphagus zhangzhouensis]|uniref:Ribosome maturation factor RimM n=1 Tax=Algoriphagus zhangzhouensis TaxID=1073327 RepID=A0A1M7ZFU0_9BACT|nr:ribosome maturation factor RimM [Algoriphagus zhangzhouensis]TDY44928.1 16S rRNA processing protein RimM [Algoriphagus zhangzhouensis]SHO63781.1 16S rRNA processing protein RimM [Algoriphagus zhangzhouensis]
MNKEQCFQLGYVAKVHGLRGEVVIVLDVDYPEEYEDLEHLFLDQKGRMVPFFLEHFVLQPGNKVLAKFEELDSLEQVEGLVGSEVYLPLTALPELNEDQYYYHELIGFEVEDESKGLLGPVEVIYDMETQDLLGVKHQGKEILIPIQDGIITKVDKAAKKVYCQLPDGLLDIYLED